VVAPDGAPQPSTCVSLFPAYFPTCKAEMKMHALLDLRGNHTGEGRGRHTRPASRQCKHAGCPDSKVSNQGHKERDGSDPREG